MPLPRRQPAGPVVYRTPDVVPSLAANWSASLKTASFYALDYSDYANFTGNHTHRIGVLPTAAGPDLMLPFTADRHLHPFSVGERPLARIRTSALQLQNSWLAEGHTPKDIAKLLTAVLAQERADLINLGDVLQESALCAALDALPWPYARLRIERKDSVRWLINLPQTWNDYLAKLPRKDRKNLAWKERKAEKQFDLRIETFTDTGNLERFLVEGEKISRRTYQWHVGQQLRNDRPTLERYRALAEQGRLRCYLLLVDGVPRAFSRGVVSGDFFHEETPGYDPDFASYSIGTILMLRVVQDLIENRVCKTYDFGSGGDWSGFKSRFGNRAYNCNSYYVVNLSRPRGLLLYAAHKLLSGTKNLAARLVPEGSIRATIKRRIRKYGD